MNSSLKVAITTLGCKVNRADADALLARLGTFARQVPFDQQADLYIVNSCTVTATADRQSRQMVHRARRTNPLARVVLTGCMATRQQDSPAVEADGVFPHLQHADLVRYARGLLPGAPAVSEVAQPLPRDRRRPFLKVQDGCDASCTYCVVSLARGPSRSLPQQEVLAQLRSLAQQGHAEVVLTGIHLGQYGPDLQPPTTLTELVQACLGLVPRLRISSLEPLEVPPALARLVATSDGICPHLHLPIQSGDDQILAAMNRPYRRHQVVDLLHDLRRSEPDLALGTDLMTGFPAEDEGRFEATMELVQQTPLTHLHVFPFSPRPGTAAAQMSGQVPGPVARQRAARLRQLGQRKLAAFAATQVGQVRQVLVERAAAQPGQLLGLTDNYLRAQFPADQRLIGQLAQVRLEQQLEGALRGHLTEPG